MAAFTAFSLVVRPRSGTGGPPEDPPPVGCLVAFLVVLVVWLVVMTRALWF